MTQANQILYAVFTLILSGILTSAIPYLKSNKSGDNVRPSNAKYAVIALGFHIFSFLCFALSPSISPTLLTLGNTCFISGFIFLGLYIKLINNKKTRLLTWFSPAVILLIGCLFEYLRQTENFEVRVIFVVVLLATLFIWIIVELLHVRKNFKNYHLDFLLAICILELALTILRLFLVVSGISGSSNTIYSESTISSLVRVLALGATVLSYSSILGFWADWLKKENSEKTEENLRINELLAERDSLNDALIRSIAEKSSIKETADNFEKTVLEAFNILAKERDNNTGNHIIRTQHYVRALANKLLSQGKLEEQGLEGKCDAMFAAAPLHDIGKVGIPDAILLKQGKLTDAEWDVMKTHTLIGERILSAKSFASKNESLVLRVAKEIAGSHHENWDGTGYPRGLVGREIPQSARIMAVADVYDALVTDRPYKQAWSTHDALAYINELKAQKFDPEVVEALAEVMREFEIIQQQYKDK